MPPWIGAVVFSVVIVALYWLNRDPSGRTSKALWIPTIWFLLAASRSVTQWLGISPIVTSVDQVLEGSPIDRMVFTGLIAAGMVVVVTRWRDVATILRANRPIVVFFAYCAVSLFWSDFQEVSFKRWTKAVGDFAMVLIVLSDPDPIAAVKRLLARASFLLVPLSVLIIKYYPELGKGYGRWDGVAFFTGVTTNKNALGVICLFLGLAALWRILAVRREREHPRRGRWLIVHGTILLMVFWLFWKANSMTSLSCFLVGIVLLFVTRGGEARRPALVHVLVAGMVAFTGAVAFLGLSPELLTSIGRDPTLTDRTEVWSVAIGLIDDRLIGTGFESFWLGPRLEAMWNAYSWQPNQAHNGYLEIFLNLGWVGVALLALVIGTGYRAVLAGYRQNPSMGSLMLAYFVIGVVYNFTEAAFFRIMAPAWILFLLAITRTPERAASETASVDTAGVATLDARLDSRRRPTVGTPASWAAARAPHSRAS
jgi:exopolysaccharide production protein ExoQ